MKIQTIILNEKRNVSLTAYLLDVGGEYRNVTRRPAVMVIPGGGYQFCSDREADPVAMAYLKAGFDAFILRYSVGSDAAWPAPLTDYECAMKTILEHAEEWAVIPDKIAVAGFSAGGHLAAAAATMSKHRPAAAVLGYPVIREDTARECAQSAPAIVPHVNEKTCPCFLFATRTDTVVPIQNTIDMLNALNQFAISFECHIYGFGPARIFHRRSLRTIQGYHYSGPRAELGGGQHPVAARCTRRICRGRTRRTGLRTACKCRSGRLAVAGLLDLASLRQSQSQRSAGGCHLRNGRKDRAL